MKCKKSSSLQIHTITSSLHLNSSTFWCSDWKIKHKHINHSMNDAPQSHMVKVSTCLWPYLVQGFSPIPPKAGLLLLPKCRLSNVCSDNKPQRTRTKCLSHLPETLMRDCEEACQCDNNYRNGTIQQLQASHPLHTSVAFGKTHTHTQAATLNRSATTDCTFPS